MLEIELVIFRDYIETNLALGFIKKLNNLVEILILFIKKKDGNLKLVVDY